MCLAVPGRIVRLVGADPASRSAEVAYPGQHRTVSLLYLPEARVGDHVLVQAGFAIRRLTDEQAREVTDALASQGTQRPSVGGSAPGVTP